MMVWLVSSPSVTALMTMSAMMKRSVRGSSMSLRNTSIRFPSWVDNTFAAMSTVNVVPITNGMKNSQA